MRWWVVLNESGRPLAFAESREAAVEAWRAAGGGGRVKRLFNTATQRHLNEQRAVAARKQNDGWQLKRSRTHWECWKCGRDIPSASDYFRLERPRLALCEPCYET